MKEIQNCQPVHCKFPTTLLMVTELSPTQFSNANADKNRSLLFTLYSSLPLVHPVVQS